MWALWFNGDIDRFFVSSLIIDVNDDFICRTHYTDFVMYIMFKPTRIRYFSFLDSFLFILSFTSFFSVFFYSTKLFFRLLFLMLICYLHLLITIKAFKPYYLNWLCIVLLLFTIEEICLYIFLLKFYFFEKFFGETFCYIKLINTIIRHIIKLLKFFVRLLHFHIYFY